MWWRIGFYLRSFHVAIVVRVDCLHKEGEAARSSAGCETRHGGKAETSEDQRDNGSELAKSCAGTDEC